MSFLQFISQKKRSSPHNRAIRQLYKGKLVHRVNLSHNCSHQSTNPAQEQKPTTPEKPNHFKMKSSPIELNDIPEPLPTSKTQPLKQKLTSNASRSKYFMLKQNNYEGSSSDHTDHQIIMKHHDSFSSYLLKNRPQSRANRNFKYFDLDQIADQLATPKKLQNKLATQERFIQKRINNINLQKYQHFLKNIDKDQDRYNKMEEQHKIKRSRYSKLKSNNYLDQESSHRKSQLKYRSFLREKTDRATRIQKIMPWKENEEEHSPLPKQRQTYTEIKSHSPAYPFHL